LEIILVDDGSPDKSPEMCDVWAKKDSRIKVIHKKNGGLGDARNAGLDVASGDLIGFVDSDDWCEPTMYEKMIASYKEHCMPVVVCDVWVDWENGWSSEKKCFGEGSVSWNRIEAAEAFCGEGLPAWMCNKLFERQLWNGVRFTSQLYEDIPVMRRFLTSVNGISFTRTLEYHYIQHQNSIVNSSCKKSI
jgi:glycosyltransferase involved in cell wall biosynthesis